jgi:hypothetical protein
MKMCKIRKKLFYIKHLQLWRQAKQFIKIISKQMRIATSHPSGHPPMHTQAAKTANIDTRAEVGAESSSV